MCISQNYKYKTHPLLRIFPNLYDIRCLLTLTYESEIEDYKICMKCYRQKRPENLILTADHLLADGNMKPRKCQECDAELVRIRSILNCDKCFTSYVRFMTTFKKYHSNDIAFLLFDVNAQDIIYLFIYEEDPVTEVQPELLFEGTES